MKYYLIVLVLISFSCKVDKTVNYAEEFKTDSLNIRLSEKVIFDKYFGKIYIVDIVIKNATNKGYYIDNFYPMQNLIINPPKKIPFKIELFSGIQVNPIDPVEKYYYDNLIHLNDIDSLFFNEIRDSLLTNLAYIKDENFKTELKSQIDLLEYSTVIIKPMSEYKISLPFTEFDKGKNYQLLYVLFNSYFYDKKKLSLYKKYIQLPDLVLGYKKIPGALISNTLCIKAN